MKKALLAVLMGITALVVSSCTGDQVWRNPKDNVEYVYIPAGVLIATRVDGEEGAVPDTFSVQEYWMTRTEVTVGQFRRFISETGYVTEAESAGNRHTWRDPGFVQEKNHPVVYVSIKDARRYASWAGVDLPTDQEWIYASRAGSTTRFYWGDELDDRYVWHRENSSAGTHEVGLTLPNAWGLYDMVGNAKEWVAVCDSLEYPRGESWTRCPKYDLFGREVEPFAGEFPGRLQTCQPGLIGNSWDDDRGFRLVRRDR